MLPGLLGAAGSQRGSGSDVRQNGLGALPGAAESLTACRRIGLMRQHLSGALVFRSSTKSLQKHVEQFRQLYFNSAKLYEGTCEKQIGPGCVRMRVKRSSPLSLPSHTLGQARFSGDTQSFISSSLKYQSISARPDDETGLRRKVTWLRMQRIIVCFIPRRASITSSGFLGTGSPDTDLTQPTFRVMGFMCMW